MVVDCTHAADVVQVLRALRWIAARGLRNARRQTAAAGRGCGNARRRSGRPSTAAYSFFIGPLSSTVGGDRGQRGFRRSRRRRKRRQSLLCYKRRCLKHPLHSRHGLSGPALRLATGHVSALRSVQQSTSSAVESSEPEGPFQRRIVCYSQSQSLSHATLREHWASRRLPIASRSAPSRASSSCSSGACAATKIRPNRLRSIACARSRAAVCGGQHRSSVQRGARGVQCQPAGSAAHFAARAQGTTQTSRTSYGTPPTCSYSPSPSVAKRALPSRTTQLRNEVHHVRQTWLGLSYVAGL